MAYSHNISDHYLTARSGGTFHLSDFLPREGGSEVVLLICLLLLAVCLLAHGRDHPDHNAPVADDPVDDVAEPDNQPPDSSE